ncbi:hypothetical protein MSAN_01185100 [Mycena sanguinolenta]|uniref:Uncharacterized protein n=1 Tax=Mycena sanguinolenta TaxID=230812 RepID=A0A8H6YI08_9AGAR|nr:hypothetical protein MSAN_01185100 [Mycena sanguinolenta]
MSTETDVRVVQVTPWMVFKNAVVLGLGIYKAVAVYTEQQPATPTTLDLVLLVLWTLIASWLSTLEKDAQLGPRGRWFFTHDLSGSLFWMILRRAIYSFLQGLFMWVIISPMDFYLKLFNATGIIFVLYCLTCVGFGPVWN